MTESRPHHRLALTMMMNPWGAHAAGWRVQHRDPAFGSVDRYIEFAQLADNAGIDALFQADTIVVPISPQAGPWSGFDPLVLLPILSQHTERVGLIATVSTTHNSPFTLARTLGTFDVLTGGRVGWNIVTTADARVGAQLGVRGELSGEQRYARAGEFVDIALGIWDSWAPQTTFGADTGAPFVDPERARPFTYHGDHLWVEHALATVPPSPQRRPLLVQAGASESGRAFAAEYADVVFTVQHNISDAVAFRTEIRDRARARGRQQLPLVLPGVHVYLEDSTDSARAARRELDELDGLDNQLAFFSHRIGIPVENLHIDETIPQHVLDAATPAVPAFHQAVARYLADAPLTVRELLMASVHTHRNFVGTASALADSLREWFDAGAADGFNISSGRGLIDTQRFTTDVVPLLVANGLRDPDSDIRPLRHRFSSLQVTPRRDHQNP